MMLEGIAWRFRTGAPWRDVPERFGPWQTVYDRHNLWSENGTYALIFRHLLGAADTDAELDWLVSVDSTIVRAHQHAAGARREDQGGHTQHTGARSNYKDRAAEPDDHALGRSPRGWTTKTHLACDGKGRPLSLVVTAGNINDTTMLGAVLDAIVVPRNGRPGRGRRRPGRVLADKGYRSRANRGLLRSRGIAHTIPEPKDQKANRTRRGSKGGRFDWETYRHRNTVERCFNRLKQWRGLAMRSDKHAHNYERGLRLASAVLWGEA